MSELHNFPAANDELSAKSSAELLEEIDTILKNADDSEAAADEAARRLALLQKRAPVMEDYKPDEAWAKMAAAYPNLFAQSASAQTARPRRASSRRRTWLRIAGIAAAVIILFAVTAGAFGFRPFRTVFQWVDDVIHVYTKPSGALELPEETEATDGGSQYRSLREALDADDLTDVACPAWIPKDYALQNVTVQKDEAGGEYSALYCSARGDLTIRINYYNFTDTIPLSRSVEGDPNFSQVFQYHGMTYLITDNAGYYKAVWDTESCMCSMFGQVTPQELKEMVESLK